MNVESNLNYVYSLTSMTLLPRGGAKYCNGETAITQRSLTVAYDVLLWLSVITLQIISVQNNDLLCYFGANITKYIWG